MFNKKLFLLGLGLTFTVGLCGLHNRAVAEEVGTTDEGNVIYRFVCPSSTSPKHAVMKIDWPNHLGSHPEWDIEPEDQYTNEGNNNGRTPEVRAKFKSKSRSGQRLECRYDILHDNRPNNGSVYYRYKVHRDIISCENDSSSSGRGWKCILKASGGGGKSHSSIESSSPPPEKCVGLGCDTQPNPGGCIGRGCDKKSSVPEPVPPSKSMPEP